MAQGRKGVLLFPKKKGLAVLPYLNIRKDYSSILHLTAAGLAADLVEDTATVSQEHGTSTAAAREPFALPSVLDLAAAPALAHALREQLLADIILLDGNQVERIATPCIQILLATALDAQSRGISFHLREPSPVLASAIADLGLASGFKQ